MQSALSLKYSGPGHFTVKDVYLLRHYGKTVIHQHLVDFFLMYGSYTVESFRSRNWTSSCVRNKILVQMEDSLKKCLSCWAVLDDIVGESTIGSSFHFLKDSQKKSVHPHFLEWVQQLSPLLRSSVLEETLSLEDMEKDQEIKKCSSCSVLRAQVLNIQWVSDSFDERIKNQNEKEELNERLYLESLKPNYEIASWSFHAFDQKEAVCTFCGQVKSFRSFSRKESIEELPQCYQCLSLKEQKKELAYKSLTGQSPFSHEIINSSVGFTAPFDMILSLTDLSPQFSLDWKSTGDQPAFDFKIVTEENMDPFSLNSITGNLPEKIHSSLYKINSLFGRSNGKLFNRDFSYLLSLKICAFCDTPFPRLWVDSNNMCLKCYTGYTSDKVFLTDIPIYSTVGTSVLKHFNGNYYSVRCGGDLLVTKSFIKDYSYVQNLIWVNFLDIVPSDFGNARYDCASFSHLLRAWPSSYLTSTLDSLYFMHYQGESLSPVKASIPHASLKCYEPGMELCADFSKADIVVYNCKLSTFSFKDWFHFSGVLSYMRDQALLLIIEPDVSSRDDLVKVLQLYGYFGKNIDLFNPITERSFLANFPVYVVDKGKIDGEVSFNYWFFRVPNKTVTTSVRRGKRDFSLRKCCMCFVFKGTHCFSKEVNLEDSCLDCLDKLSFLQVDEAQEGSTILDSPLVIVSYQENENDDETKLANISFTNDEA
jgi:hypothetical protein